MGNYFSIKPPTLTDNEREPRKDDTENESLLSSPSQLSPSQFTTPDNYRLRAKSLPSDIGSIKNEDTSHQDWNFADPRSPAYDFKRTPLSRIMEIYQENLKRQQQCSNRTENDMMEESEELLEDASDLSLDSKKSPSNFIANERFQFGAVYPYMEEKRNYLHIPMLIADICHSLPDSSDLSKLRDMIETPQIDHSTPETPKTKPTFRSGSKVSTKLLLSPLSPSPRKRIRKFSVAEDPSENLDFHKDDTIPVRTPSQSRLASKSPRFQKLQSPLASKSMSETPSSNRYALYDMSNAATPYLNL